MEEKEIDLLTIINFFNKHKKFIIITWGGVTLLIVIAMVISLILPAEKSFLPNKFTASSIVKINNPNSSSGLSDMINSSGLGFMANLTGLDMNQGNHSASWAIELSKSRTVLDEISEAFNLTALYGEKSKYPVVDTRKTILKNLVVEESPDTGALIIKYTDIDKMLAANVVNKLTNILDSAFGEIDKISNETNLDVVTKKISEKERYIELLLSDLTVFQREHKILEPYIMFQEITKNIMTLRASVNAKESELEFLKSNFSNVSPKVYTKELDLEAAKKLLQDMENGKGSADLPSLFDMSTILTEYEKKKKFLDAHRELYSLLLKQYEILNLEKSGKVSTFQVVENAEIPKIKSGPSRGKICIIGCFISFFLAVMMAFLKDFWKELKNSQSNN